MNNTINPPLQQDSQACSCQEKLPQIAIRGLQLFNAGDFFEAHERLEIAWRAEKRPIRELYRGILQVGVGFYHIQHENYSGAHKLFQRALVWLYPFPSLCQGVDVDFIRRQTIKVDNLLVSSFPNPSRSALESLFFMIPFQQNSEDIHE